MTEEPIARKIWRRITMGHQSNPDEAALRLINAMPKQLVDDIVRSPDESLIQHKVRSWIKSKHLEIETRTTEDVTRFLQARRNAWVALSEHERAKRDAIRIHKKVDQEEEIADLQHEAERAELTTKIVQEENKQKDLGDPRGPFYRTLVRIKDEALAKQRTFADLARELDAQIAAELELFKAKPNVTPEDLERRRRELEEIRSALLADFADALAKRTRTDAPGWSDPFGT